MDICKIYCAFYKPIKKEINHCYGYDLVKRLIDANLLDMQAIPIFNIKNFKNKNNSLLKNLICKKCPFFVDGCDFRDTKINGKQPCGGYIIIDLLLESGRISSSILS